MLRINFILIIAITLCSVEIFADAGLKSGFDKSGNFNNRLQFDGEYIDFSLLSSVSAGGLEWLEPAFLMKSLYIGRIQLRGIVREFHNPDGNSSFATVLSELSGLRVTDSMSRSSRYGIIINPFDDYDCSAWLYRANSGLFSAGIMYCQPEIFQKSVFSMDGELFIAACSCEEGTSSGWFSPEVLLPSQTCLNTAVEIRVSTDGNSGSRRSLPPRGDLFTWSLSVAASGSLPQYTSPGGLFRAVSFAGTENLYISGLFQSASFEYISASGEVPDSRFTASCGVCGSACSECCSISGKIEYCFKQKMQDIIPARCSEQVESIDSKLELSAGMLILKLEAGYSTVCESSGAETAKTDFEACLKLDADIIIMDIGCTLNNETADYTVNSQSLSPSYDGGVVYTAERFKLGFRCGYKDQAVSYRINSGLTAETYRISGSIEFMNEAVNSVSISFESQK